MSSTSLLCFFSLYSNAPPFDNKQASALGMMSPTAFLISSGVKLAAKAFLVSFNSSMEDGGDLLNSASQMPENQPVIKW